MRIDLLLKPFLFYYPNHGEAVHVFALGLFLSSPNPANKREKNEFFSFNIIYHCHGEAVLAFLLGLLLALVNNFKPSEEEEKMCSPKP